MSTTTHLPIPPPLMLRLEPAVKLDDEQLYKLCQRNRDLRIERDATGALCLMTPTGGGTANRNAAITAHLWLWARRDRTGRAFDSSGGFLLPNGALRAPDAAWVRRSRLSRLTPRARDRFLALCPDFVIELRSPSDALAALEEKMLEYSECGARLGWLIDPVERRVHVYRPGAEVEVLDQPASVGGNPELTGFVLEMGEIWDPVW